ncbi:MAG: hypothetical protein R3Y04_02240 [Rikenellaceae bacterium]
MNKNITIISILHRTWIVVVAMLIIACSNQDDDQDSVSAIVDSVWEYSINNPDGFTVEIPSLNTPTSGLAVGYYIGQENVGKESLTDVVNHALNNGKFVGGWLDTEDGQYYFDSICIFEDGAHDEAEQFAIDNQQRAYYDLKNEVTIYVILE